MSPYRGKVSYRPSAGLVLGFISLFVALTSVAAGNLPGKNSVNSGDIAAKNVKTSDIAIGAVTSGRIADGAVKTSKLAANAVDNGKLAANAVDTGQIADNAVTNPKLAADAVDSSKVANGSLTGADVAPNSLTGVDINESTLGPVLDVTYARNFNNCTVADGTQGSCTATCPAGTNAIGGGGVGEGGFADHVQVNGSRPNPNGAVATGWTTFFNNEAGGANNNVPSYAICVPIASGAFLAVNG
jgi:hypothetical protein